VLHPIHPLPYGEAIALSDIGDALIIKEGDLFLMTDADGNIPRGNRHGYGLYKGDTRYLSVYDLSFGEVKPVALLSTGALGYASEHHLTNPALQTAEGKHIPKETLEIRRHRIVNSNRLLESIQVTNYGIFRATVNLCFDFNADFVDIFEVRSMRRRHRGRLSTPKVSADSVMFEYVGLDNVQRRTEIKFSPPPLQIWHNGALFVISLGHRESTTISVTVSLDGAEPDGAFSQEFSSLASAYSEWLNSCTQVFTSNEFFNAMLERSLSDIRMLMNHGSNSAGRYVAAGVPWFNCLFGRDSIIVALQTLAFNPAIARDTLRILAQWQGQKIDTWRDEEPGKILHELRTGEMATVGEIPSPYYGSIDATPLFLILATKYFAWTNDLAVLHELKDSLLKALKWIDEYGDSDKCGYVEYSKRSHKGLINQGWKDSRDGIVNNDGTLARPPIALAEVQGYVYAAKRGMAWLLPFLGEHELGKKLRQEAAKLKRRFNRDFWLEEERFYALALANNKEPVRSITSNPGQCLWTGIIERNKAANLVERLFSNEMFSGWGIRTLSSCAARYNPLGYHLGTVWPHDNSIIAMGLKEYGFENELNELATALYDCCRCFDYYRLPELFCGTPRSAYSLPVRYPVACRPQAWAAGTLPFLLQALLGLVPNAPDKELWIVRPQLPYWLERVEVRKLRVGDVSVDLLFERVRGRTRVVTLRTNGLKVSVLRSKQHNTSRPRLTT